MKKLHKSLLLFLIVFVLCSCGKKSYVVFDYNCNGTDYHKCELKNNKLNCSVETPSCGEYKFKGWFRANEYNNPVDLNGTFNKNEIIYARWEKGNGIIEPSSSQEPISTIITPGIIDIPSSSKEEPSSSQQQVTPPTPVNPPKPEETYTISFNLNGGTGGQTSSISGVKYNNDLPKINQTKPTKPGYTFMGWYDKTTGGTQYYNSSNSGVRKYDKKSNITLYAQWKINVLSIQYNGNGGVWNSKNTNYYVNSNGTVMSKSTNQVYKQVYNYGTKLESSGLTDCNGSWFSWKKDGYMVKSGKQYLIGSTVVDQAKVYSVNDLAKYAGCDLSKTNCTITAKVNWEKNIYEDYGPCKIVLKSIRVNHDTRKYGICVPEQYNGQKLPMIFFLHGMNGDPNSTFYSDFNVWVNAGHNGVINNWPKYGLKNIPAIMVMPWIQFQDKWNNEYEYKFVNGIYNEVINNYNIDTDNVCLMGASIGGQGVFTVAARFPTYWKSIVAMSALITKPGAGDKEYFKNMPMKGFAEKYNPKTHSETYNYEKKMIELFEYIEHPNDLMIVPVRHMQVAEYAFTIDENGDGISDLAYWAINGGQDPES